MSDIDKKLLPFLKWLSGQRLTPKLEGRYISNTPYYYVSLVWRSVTVMSMLPKCRFGRLPWRQNADKYDVLNFQTEEFVHVALDDPSSHFLSK